MRAIIYEPLLWCGVKCVSLQLDRPSNAPLASAVGSRARGRADRTSSIEDENKARILMAQQLADEMRTASSQGKAGG